MNLGNLRNRVARLERQPAPPSKEEMILGLPPAVFFAVAAGMAPGREVPPAVAELFAPSDREALDCYERRIAEEGRR